MLNHRQRHKPEGWKRHACSICSYSTNYSSHLRQHMFTHSGERPYKCTQCNSGFTQNSLLRKHLLTHDPDAIEQGKKQKAAAKKKPQPAKDTKGSNRQQNRKPTTAAKKQPKKKSAVGDGHKLEGSENKPTVKLELEVGDSKLESSVDVVESKTKCEEAVDKTSTEYDLDEDKPQGNQGSGTKPLQIFSDSDNQLSSDSDSDESRPRERQESEESSPANRYDRDDSSRGKKSESDEDSNPDNPELDEDKETFKLGDEKNHINVPNDDDQKEGRMTKKSKNLQPSSAVTKQHDTQKPESSGDKVAKKQDKDANEEMQLKCARCSEVCSNAKSFSKHMRIHKRQDKPHKCKICYKRFSKESYLKKHIKKQHTGKKADEKGSEDK